LGHVVGDEVIEALRSARSAPRRSSVERASLQALAKS